MCTLIPAVDTYKILFITMFTDQRPLCTIMQMPLLNLLLNSLRKCHYSNHYSSLPKGHFYYSSLLSHYALGTLLMYAHWQIMHKIMHFTMHELCMNYA